MRNLLICALSLGSLVLQASEKITLKNGKVFFVETTSGMPMGFDDGQVKVKAVGPVIGPDPKTGARKMLWMFLGVVKVPGEFKLVITSPLDESIKAETEIKAPGQFYFDGFPDSEAPAVWSWLKESGTSWIPFVLTFQNADPKKSFEIIQWTKFDSKSKELLVATFERMASLKKP